MKAAVLSDIHGNSPALEAVLDAVDREKPEKIYVLGDAAHGVDPKGCLSLLIERENCLCIKGNLEHYACADSTRWTRERDSKFEWKQSVGTTAREWAGDKLFRYMCGWPDYIQEDGVYFMHDAPWDRRAVEFEGSDLPVHLRDFAYHARGILPCELDEQDNRELEDFFSSHDVSMLFCGHRHVSFVHELDGGTVVGCGSVGQPFERDPRAVWVAWEDDLSVSVRRTEYDIDRTVALYLSGPIKGDDDNLKYFRLGLELGDHPNDLRKRMETDS